MAAADVERAFAELEAVARDTLAGEGYPADQLRLTRALDTRYLGQSFELRLALEESMVDDAVLEDLPRRFGVEHERTYGHQAPADPVEVVNVRVAALAVESRPSPGRLSTSVSDTSRLHRAPTDVGGMRGSRRPAYFGPDPGLIDTPVLGRDQVGLELGAGPLIVEEYDATTIVPPGVSVRRDSLNNLILELGGPE